MVGSKCKIIISTAPGSSNGRTAAFGAAYLGSNPSPGAVLIKSFVPETHSSLAGNPSPGVFKL